MAIETFLATISSISIWLYFYLDCALIYFLRFINLSKYLIIFYDRFRYLYFEYFFHFPYSVLVNNNSMPTVIQPIFTFKSFHSLLFKNLLTAKGWKTQIPSCQNIAPKCCRHLSKAMMLKTCTFRVHIGLLEFLFTLLENCSVYEKNLHCHEKKMKF